MRYIGDISSKSAILLEILTKDSENNALELDKPVEVLVKLNNQDSLEVIDNVILNMSENGYIHSFKYDLSELNTGMYLLEYLVTSKNITYKAHESFYLKEEAVDIEEDDDSSNSDYGEDTEEYIPSFLRESIDLVADDNKVLISFEEGMDANSKYYITISEGLKSVSGDSLYGQKTISFISQITPMYSTALEVRGLLKDIFFYFDIEDILKAINEASQKTHQLLRLPPSPLSQGYEEIQVSEYEHFPATKFVAYQSAVQLLNKLLIKIIYSKDSEGSIFSEEGLSGGFKLGDFSVNGKEKTSDTVKAKDLPEIAVVNELIKEHERELIFWRDALMNRNARGYTTPKHAISRGAVVSPESRDV